MHWYSGWMVLLWLSLVIVSKIQVPFILWPRYHQAFREQEKRMCEEGISSLNCLSSNPSAPLTFQVQDRVTSSYKGLIIVVQLCIERRRHVSWAFTWYLPEMGSQLRVSQTLKTINYNIILIILSQETSTKEKTKPNLRVSSHYDSEG